MPNRRFLVLLIVLFVGLSAYNYYWYHGDVSELRALIRFRESTPDGMKYQWERDYVAHMKEELQQQPARFFYREIILGVVVVSIIVLLYGVTRSNQLPWQRVTWWVAPFVLTLAIWSLQAASGAAYTLHPTGRHFNLNADFIESAPLTLFFVSFQSPKGVVALILFIPLLVVHIGLIIVARRQGWGRTGLAVLYSIGNLAAAIVGGAYFYFAAGGSLML